jgi:N-acyl amino acid synthase of PEP-CTERM/exosortase system
MFHVKRVQKQSEIERLYALRYQVYCHERMFLDPRDYPNGLEHDEYDASAIHIGAYGPENTLYGSLRLVRSTEMHFPIFDHCDVQELPKDATSLEFFEISRLLISKRKRSANRDPNAVASIRAKTERQDFTDFPICLEK